MRISVQCGLIEAGLAACISSFAFIPAAALSEITSVSLSSTNTEAAFERLEVQQKVIGESIERLRQNSEAALNSYTEAVLFQFELLQQNFAAQRVDDAAAWERINRMTRNVVVVMVGVMVASLIILAWIPVWATSRLTKRFSTHLRTRSVPISEAATAPPDEAEISDALVRLERRLLLLEQPPSSSPEPRPSTAAPEHIQQQPPPAKTPQPRVALTLGDGSALMFFPHELQSTRRGRFRRQIARFKRFLARVPSAMRF